MGTPVVWPLRYVAPLRDDHHDSSQARDKKLATGWSQPLDTGIRGLREYGPLVVTTDHGMSDKTRRIYLEEILATDRIMPDVVLLTRDSLTYRQYDLGGAA